MGARTLFFVSTFALFLSLFVTSVRADDCVPERQLWGALIAHQHSQVTEEEIFCLHGQVHPTKAEYKCTHSLSSFEKAIDAAVTLCKDQTNPKAYPKKVPKYVTRLVKKWARYQRLLGVREEVICCVHDRVHAYFSKPQLNSHFGIWKKRRYFSFYWLHNWQVRCAKSTNNIYGFAY